METCMFCYNSIKSPSVSILHVMMHHFFKMKPNDPASPLVFIDSEKIEIHPLHHGQSFQAFEIDMYVSCDSFIRKK